jgi:hypothetical protein
MQEKTNTQFEWRTLLKTATLERRKLIEMNNFDIHLKKTDFDDMDFIILAEQGVKTSF